MPCSNLTTTLPMLGCCGGDNTAVACSSQVRVPFAADFAAFKSTAAESIARVNALQYPTAQEGEKVVRREFFNIRPPGWVVQDSVCPDPSLVVYRAGLYHLLSGDFLAVKILVTQATFDSYCIATRENALEIEDNCGDILFNQNPLPIYGENIYSTQIPVELLPSMPTDDQLLEIYNSRDRYGWEKRIIKFTEPAVLPKCNLAP